jgi:two-component system, chemotaxis family, chemotaxis protein CheY
MALKILLVDDSRLSRTLTRHIMESLHPGLEVFEASDGATAIAFLDTQSVDIGLIDINMPGLSGLDLIEAIREKWPSTRLAMLTANIQEGMRKRAEELDVLFFMKPITEELVYTIFSSFAI